LKTVGTKLLKFEILSKWWFSLCDG